MAQKIQIRRDTAANWTTANPVLAQGEPGHEIDTGKVKFGNGIDNWNSLIYQDLTGSSWTQTGSGAVTRTVDEKLKDVVSVKDFGAVGDGVANDTAAIQLANNSGASAIYFPVGTYQASGLIMSTSWHMADGALIRFNGSINTPCITCSGSNLSGNLNVSANGGSPSQLVNITGNDNRFSRIVVQDMVSPSDPSVHVALRIGGNNNKILEAVGFDLLNTGNINSSSPQFVTLGGSSDKNHILKISADNARNAFLTVSPGENYVGDIIATDCGDNGIYCTNGRTIINSLSYGGTDEAAVFIGGADASLNTLTVTNAANTGIRIEGCGVVDIGQLIVLDNGLDRLFRQSTNPSAVSDTLRIGHIQGEFTGSALFQLLDGVVKNLVIGSMDVTFIFDAAVMTGSTFSWARADMAEGVHIGTANITIVDKNDVLTGSDIFETRLRNPLLRPSFIDAWNVHIVNADRVTTSAAAARINSVGDPLLTVRSGYIQANAGRGYLREIISTRPSDRLVGNTIPTVGTWKHGQVLWTPSPSTGGLNGWICTAAGTPGTWVPIGYNALNASVSYDPPNLPDGDGVTTTVSVPGAAMGDFAFASFAQTLAGITLTAWVSSTDTVSVRFQNESGGAINPGNATLRVRVQKA
jgi:hypothetical protein